MLVSKKKSSLIDGDSVIKNNHHHLLVIDSPSLSQLKLLCRRRSGGSVRSSLSSGKQNRTEDLTPVPLSHNFKFAYYDGFNGSVLRVPGSCERAEKISIMSC